MKHLFKNEIKHLLGGGTIRGLNVDSFMFFLDNLSDKTARKKVLILTEEPVLSHFVRQRGFFKNNLYFFPKQQKNSGSLLVHLSRRWNPCQKKSLQYFERNTVFVLLQSESRTVRWTVRDGRTAGWSDVRTVGRSEVSKTNWISNICMNFAKQNVI